MTEQATTDKLIFEKKHLLAEYKDEILKALEALTKVAKRVGVPAPTWTMGATYDFEFEVKIGESGYGEDYEEEWETYIEPVFDITINLSECIKMAGDWRLIAAISHRAEGILQIDADFELPTRFTPKIETCEHCNVKMPRVMSYVIYSPTKGFMQVGKTCMKQFLGINPTSYISMFEAISKFSPMIEAMGYAKNRGGRLDNLAYSVEEIFKLTYRVVQLEGKFVKNEWKVIETGGSNWRGEPDTRNVRANQGASTLDKVNERIVILNTFKRNPAELQFAHEAFENIGLAAAQTEVILTQSVIDAAEDKNTPAIEEVKQAHGQARYNVIAISNYMLYADSINIADSYKEEFTAVKNWAANLEINISEGGVIDNFDAFKQGVKDTMSKARTLQSHAKYITSGYGTYLNEIRFAAEREERLKKAETQEYVGVIGEKSKLALKITGYKTGESNFGMWELWTMEDDNGNQFSKFGKLDAKYITGDIDIVMFPNSYAHLTDEERAEKQPIIVAKFTVKDHKVYKDSKITELGRISKP